MGIDLKWNKAPSAISQSLVGTPSVRKFAAATWHRLYNDFIPMRTGMMASQVQYLDEGNMGVVHHTAPYSCYPYFGTGFNFSKEKHPNASAKWDQAAKAAGKASELAKQVEAFIKGGG